MADPKENDGVAAKRQQVAETRARIDRNLEELVGHVPDREDVTAVAAKWGAAVGGAVAAVGVLVVVTRSKLARRAERRRGREYAAAIAAALPEVAEAYRAHVTDRAVTAVVPAHEPLDVDAPDLGATTVDELADAASRPRGGVPTAVLTGLGVVAGVALSKKLDQG